MLIAGGVDFLTSNESGNGEKTDEEQLAFATSTGRAILTFDSEDFQRLHANWARMGRAHAGIIIVTDAYMLPPQLAEGIVGLQAERSANDMRSAILFLSPSPTQQPR